MLPFFEAQKVMEKYIEPIKVVNENSKKIMQTINSLKKMYELNEKELIRISSFTEYNKKYIDIALQSYYQMEKSFLELPQKTREVLLLLGKQGWYLDINIAMSSLWELRDALVDGDFENAQNDLIEYFDKYTIEIQTSLVNKFPTRAHIFQAAFQAHQAGQYYLSIPVLLAQTDGICKDIFSGYFFIKKNKKPQTSNYVEQIDVDSFLSALLSPLSEILPINASLGERDDSEKPFNRHLILHGDSLDYGNKVNSLKAISLLNYVAHVIDY